ncbi:MULTISPECIES: Asp23/Gls24 family envelope stress response protein [Exiguobacterium]|uniref:Asp23/Gls24 family envelope stress response protein n=1 Tax=Exiguobacterium TaxID=33986 RepID=UPI001BE87F24|nr:MULTISPECIES: Asp23/Gls24 family envelope stress response protein [Exiguobacterium]MCT4781609.1 Asp23/Gls24 family envelope stress response protein [Exiguobacterium himgiriensis]
MANENVNVNANRTEETVRQNKLTFEEQVIKKIAGLATNEVQGILSMSGGFMSGLTDRFRSTEDITKGIDAEVGERQVALDLRVIVEYNKNIPSVFNEAVTKIKKAMSEMTGLEVVEVNMHVEDVMTKAEFDAKSRATENETEQSRELA